MAISTTEGSYTDYAYTGGVQSLTIPADGIYKLEAWGAGGGYCGANGGYTIGYKRLTKGTEVFVVCGQSGGGENDHGNRYNGGQDGSGSPNPAHWYGKHPGGGCTHIALAGGVLASLSNNRDKVLIVAGGGGAAATAVAGGTYGGTGSGGQGGGLSGGSGSSGAGGTQTTGYAFGLGAPAVAQVDGDPQKAQSGGGAGWYGGYAGVRGGGGGSSYIDGTPEITFSGVTYTPSTTIGGGCATTTNGKARITLVKKAFLPVMFDGTQVEKILFNGTEITGLQFDGVTVF